MWHPAMIRYVASHDSIRRGVALVIAISFHLVMLVLVTRPAIHERDAASVKRGNPQAIQLRFFRPPRPSSAHMAIPIPRVIAPALPIHTTLSAHPLKPLPVQYAAHVTPPPEEHSPSPPNASTLATGNKGTINDGGFQGRLLKAQRSYAIHGIPGSDKPFVPGIHLIDPTKQGVGAVIRQAQRLFGITNHHCIDVDVWRHLTPQELSARHISPGDVDQTDEEYHCNQPPGLSF